MKSFLIVLVVLVAVVAGLGFYLGWFRLSTDQTDQKPNVTVTVDQDKFKEDEAKVRERVQEVGHSVKERTAASTDKAKEERPRP